MKIYISARFGRRAEAEGLAFHLQELGHVITSSWIWQIEDEMGGGTDGDMRYDRFIEVTARLADKDVDEVAAADALVYLSEEESNPWGRGGRHVEYGMALALKKRLFIVGPLENIFHYRKDVLQFNTREDFLDYLIETEGKQ
jgi:hypothetical protein